MEAHTEGAVFPITVAVVSPITGDVASPITGAVASPHGEAAAVRTRKVAAVVGQMVAASVAMGRREGEKGRVMAQAVGLGAGEDRDVEGVVVGRGTIEDTKVSLGGMGAGKDCLEPDRAREDCLAAHEATGPAAHSEGSKNKSTMSQGSFRPR